MYYSVWRKDANRWTNNCLNNKFQNIKDPFKLSKEAAQFWCIECHLNAPIGSYEVREIIDVCLQDCCKGINQ